MTLVGDVAQSTTPAGQERWADVFAYVVTGAAGTAAGREPVATSVAELTIGYRVPEPILARANELLPFTGVDATASRSVRVEGRPPWHYAAPDGAVGASVADVVREVKHRHRLTGVVAPLERHEEVVAGLAGAGFVAVDHVHELGHDDVPLFGPEQVKGLEFDGVVIVGAEEINDGTPRGARLLYVAMTRAVQELAFVDVTAMA
jgi:DNA helicase IV